jgi:hypothetical protein
MKNHAIMALAAALMLGAPTAVYAQSMSTPSTMDCGDMGLGAQLHASGTSYDASVARSAENPLVVQVGDCSADEVSAALASVQGTNIRDDIQGNPKAVQAIFALGATVADVLGATTTNGNLTIYLQTTG